MSLSTYISISIINILKILYSWTYITVAVSINFTLCIYFTQCLRTVFFSPHCIKGLMNKEYQTWFYKPLHTVHAVMDAM